MKNLFLGSLAFAATIAGPAMAADLPYKAPPPLPVAYYDWSGAYAGFNIGGARYDVTHHFPTPGATTPDVTTGNRDGIFGFHVGAQLQWGAWVLGAEAARIACFNECSSTSDVLPVNLGFDENTFGQHKITNLVTAGPRLGYAWDRLLVFTTGGWAWANLENTHCSSITGICGGIGPGNGVSSSNNGWYAGGGFDYVVHKGALVDMIFGVEYQHFDLNGARAFCERPGCNPPAVRDFDLSATGDLVRARLTVKTQGFFLVR
jgi:outer membrane immunogenic protein